MDNNTPAENLTLTALRNLTSHVSIIAAGSLATLIFAVSAPASFIHPDTASSNSEYPSGDDYVTTNTINQSGLSSPSAPNSSPASIHAPYTNDNHWSTDGIDDPNTIFAIYGFTTPKNLDAFYMWNHRGLGGNALSYGVTNFTLEFRDATTAVIGTLSNQTAIASSALATAQTFSFTPITGVSSVKFIINGWGGGSFGVDQDFTGLAEVAFSDFVVIPEPSTMLLLLTGGVVVWRRARAH